VAIAISPVRIGIVGAGLFGRRHAAIIDGEPLASVAAIADPSADARAWASARDYPHFTGADAMLAGTKLDAVIVATPNATHVPVGVACLRRGLPVLIEKPIAESVAGARELIAAAKAAGVALLVGHHRRYNPILEKAREIVQGGQLGRLTAVTAMWMLQKPESYFDVAWRSEAGGGPILINLIHDIDDLRYVCGEITSVQAMTSNAVRRFAVEDTAVITLRFANSALATVTVSDTVAAPWSWEITSGEAANYPQRPENCYLFAGTEASLAVPRLELWRYAGEAGWNAPLSRETIVVATADPLARQINHFCRVIRGEETPRITGEDATRTLVATLAVHEAAASGRAVYL
jgi:predicted dehydrogenase